MTRLSRPSVRRVRAKDLAALVAGLSTGLAVAGGAMAQGYVSGPATSRLSLEAGKGRLVHLDGPATGVFVGDPKIADIQVKSPTLVYVYGKAPGTTTLMAVDSHDGPLANIEVDVNYDEGQLTRDIKRLIPNSDIDVSSSSTSLVLSGVAASAADAEIAKSLALRYAPDADHVVNLIKVDSPNEITLRVRVVEVSRDIIKAFGVNYNSTFTPGNTTIGLSTGQGGVTSGVGASTGSSTLQGLSSLTVGFQNGYVNFSAVIDALDSEGFATVLAEPNLTAISGAPASFISGGEYPIPVPQSLGVTTIEYKDYGVSLAFVATITDGGRINLSVKPEVSQLTTAGSLTLNNQTVPALTKRSASTTVDLASGQSLAIAGLMQNSVNHSIQKVPGIGSIPFLGQLFRSDRFERTEDELVVIVTPYIVQPSNHRLAGPTDGYHAPTDAQRMIYGDDYNRDARPSASSPPPPPSSSASIRAAPAANVKAASVKPNSQPAAIARVAAAASPVHKVTGDSGLPIKEPSS